MKKILRLSACLALGIALLSTPIISHAATIGKVIVSDDGSYYDFYYDRNDILIINDGGAAQLEGRWYMYAGSRIGLGLYPISKCNFYVALVDEAGRIVQQYDYDDTRTAFSGFNIEKEGWYKFMIWPKSYNALCVERYSVQTFDNYN